MVFPSHDKQWNPTVASLRRNYQKTVLFGGGGYRTRNMGLEVRSLQLCIEEITKTNVILTNFFVINFSSTSILSFNRKTSNLYIIQSLIVFVRQILTNQFIVYTYIWIYTRTYIWARAYESVWVTLVYMLYICFGEKTNTRERRGIQTANGRRWGDREWLSEPNYGLEERNVFEKWPYTYYTHSIDRGWEMYPLVINLPPVRTLRLNEYNAYTYIIGKISARYTVVGYYR